MDPLVMAAGGDIRCSLDDMLVWAKNWLAPDAAQEWWHYTLASHDSQLLYEISQLLYDIPIE